MRYYYGLIDIENKGYGFVEENDPRVTEEMIKITAERHQRLLEGQSEGSQIVSANGQVFLATPNRYYIDDNAQWVRRTDEEFKEFLEQEKRERIARLSLTKREVFLALLDDKGITPEQIRGSITDEKALIEFDFATEYYRFNPLIDLIGAQLGYTSKQIDYLFVNKKFPEGEIDTDDDTDIDTDTDIDVDTDIDTDLDSDTDIDSDTDTDSDTDLDTDTDSDTDTDTDTDTDDDKQSKITESEEE